MDKVWFKLSQTHYHPGDEQAILQGHGDDDAQASLCLGHCVRDLKHLDFPLNRGAVVPFPLRSPITKTQEMGFRWHQTRDRERGLELGVGVPLAAALGLVTLHAGFRVAFQRSVAEHEEYERLDTYVVQPSRAYVDKCLEQDEIRSYVDGRRSWSFFLITGIKVARAGRRSVGMARSRKVGGGPAADVLTAAKVEVTGDFASGHSQSMEQASISDFIWAVRLAKVHKGLLVTDWSISTYTRKATFNVEGEEEVNVGSVVAEEGLSGVIIVNDIDSGEAIVLDESAWNNTTEGEDSGKLSG